MDQVLKHLLYERPEQFLIPDKVRPILTVMNIWEVEPFLQQQVFLPAAWKASSDINSFGEG